MSDIQQQHDEANTGQDAGNLFDRAWEGPLSRRKPKSPRRVIRRFKSCVANCSRTSRDVSVAPRDDPAYEPSSSRSKELVESLRIADRAPIFTLYSRPFVVHPPELVNRELIPSDVFSAMDGTWHRRNFGPRLIRGYVIDDVFIVEEGLLFDSEGKLIQESVTQHAPDEVLRGQMSVKEAIAQGQARKEGLHVLCRKRGEQNYGHWLIEMLPRIYYSRLLMSKPDLNYVVADSKEPLREIMHASACAFGVGEDVILRQGRAPQRYERVLFIDGLANHGVFMSPLVFQPLDFLSARTKGSGQRKIYVTRDSVPSRRLTNEQDVRTRATECGYTPIDPSAMSFSEQIAAFKDATEVVGVMGAALSNLAFTSPGAKVTVIAPALMPDTFFWFMAGIRGHTYREIRCRQTGPIKNVAPWDTDLELEPKDLDSLFDPASVRSV